MSDYTMASSVEGASDFIERTKHNNRNTVIVNTLQVCSIKTIPLFILNNNVTKVAW